MHFTVMPGFDVITDPRLAYPRLHGRDPEGYLKGRTVAERFHYDFSDQELDDVAACANELVGRADEMHVVLNNNGLEVAPRAAERLRRKLGH